MHNSVKTIFLFTALVTVVLLSSCSGIAVEDHAYLTPIPESTLLAYRQDMPINTRFDAVIAARRQLDATRLRFTQGDPYVVLAEKMTLAEANGIKPDNPNAVTYDDRPGNTNVWLVVFKGQWQILPPASDELTPLESGCIYVIIDIDHEARNDTTAIRECIE